VVVDAEVTSYLMMGALSPGLKRHSVTLFEAGRISGSDVMEELISELWVSHQLAQQLEGELAQIGGWLAGLATLLQAVQQAGAAAAAAAGAGPAPPLELLRKESLQGEQGAPTVEEDIVTLVDVLTLSVLLVPTGPHCYAYEFRILPTSSCWLVVCTRSGLQGKRS
jgi:hypothetical protein